MYLTTDILKRDVSRVQQLKESNVHLLAYVSDRAGRKSSAVQSRVIESALDGHPSIVIRNKTNRPITDKWFSDYVADIINKNGWKTYTENAEEFKGALTVTYLCTDVDAPAENTYILYYGMYLSVSDMYKSNFYDGWDKVDDFYFEEAVPTEKLVQDERHIIKNSMKQMIDLLSIVSTVSRGRTVNAFLLGNDIKYNLLNPITVAFDLLERLEVNSRVIDICTINDIQYPFLFLYFDFDGAVNHWLKNEDKKIDDTLSIEGLSFRNIGFKTHFKKYRIFDYKNGLYISDKLPNDVKAINSKTELLKSLGYTEYSYSPSIMLNLLRFNGTDNEKEEINKYINAYGEFKPLKIDRNVKYFDLTKIENMKIHELDTMPDGEAFKSIIYGIENSKSIFANYRIKTLLESLYYDFEIYKKTC